MAKYDSNLSTYLFLLFIDFTFDLCLARDCYECKNRVPPSLLLIIKKEIYDKRGISYVYPPLDLREETNGLIDNMCSEKDDFGVLEYCGGYCYNATVEYESKYLRCNENRISLSSHYHSIVVYINSNII